MMGDAGRRSRSTGSVQDIFESLNRRLPNRGGFDADSRRQKRLQLVQNVMNEGPASCKDCAELREKHMAEKRKYFMEVGHLRRAVNKLLDQCANFMSSTSFHKFKETLQLEVRYLTEHGDEEVMSRSPSSGRTSPGSPKMGMSYGRMEERINMLEEQNAKLEKQNKRLIEELSKQGKSTIRVGDLGRLGGISIPGNADSPPGGSSIGGSPISGMSPTSKGRRNSLATPGSASTKPAQTQTDPFPTGSRGASVSGGFHQPSNSGPSHIAYQAAQAGQGALVINGEIGSLQGDVVERAEFDRVTAERGLHRMKLTASEKKVAELSNIKAALEKQLLEHTSDKSTKEAAMRSPSLPGFGGSIKRPRRSKCSHCNSGRTACQPGLSASATWYHIAGCAIRPCECQSKARCWRSCRSSRRAATSYSRWYRRWRKHQRVTIIKSTSLQGSSCNWWQKWCWCSTCWSCWC